MMRRTIALRQATQQAREERERYEEEVRTRAQRIQGSHQFICDHELVTQSIYFNGPIQQARFENFIQELRAKSHRIQLLRNVTQVDSDYVVYVEGDALYAPIVEWLQVARRLTDDIGIAQVPLDIRYAMNTYSSHLDRDLDVDWPDNEGQYDAGIFTNTILPSLPFSNLENWWTRPLHLWEGGY